MYLGSAPGVGKTYAMLSEGHRRLDRGTDVVVGFVATYGRRQTIAMLEGLEIVPMTALEYRGRTFEEMDVDAVLERRPEVALVDELAHTNIPGARNAKRWEDVIELLADGIEVITTINIQHLESLNDVIAERDRHPPAGDRSPTGSSTSPTRWSSSTCRRTRSGDGSLHGNVYPDARKSELALQRFFTLENLTALRELALLQGGQPGRRVAARAVPAGGAHHRRPGTRPRLRGAARRALREPGPARRADRAAGQGRPARRPRARRRGRDATPNGWRASRRWCTTSAARST